jgi:TonB family protein
VKVLVVVSAQGRPISVHVTQSSGNALFDQAAVTAARASDFYPKKSFGVAVEDTVVIPYSFSATD